MDYHDDRLKRLFGNPEPTGPALRRLIRECRDAGLLRPEYQPVPPGTEIRVTSMEELRNQRREAECETTTGDDPEEQG